MGLGDKVAVQINPWTTRFGTLKRIGRTMLFVVPNGGTEAEAYKPNMVYPIGEWSTRNPNPYERINSPA